MVACWLRKTTGRRVPELVLLARSLAADNAACMRIIAELLRTGAEGVPRSTNEIRNRCDADQLLWVVALCAWRRPSVCQFGSPPG
jgi:hypothetical protein